MSRCGACVGILALLAVQGCGGSKDKDKGICEQKEVGTDKAKKQMEMCCKDGKPGEGAPAADCCTKKSEADVKKCLGEELAKKAKAAPAPSGKATGKPGETTTAKGDV